MKTLQFGNSDESLLFELVRNVRNFKTLEEFIGEYNRRAQIPQKPGALGNYIRALGETRMINAEDADTFMNLFCKWMGQRRSIVGAQRKATETAKDAAKAAVKAAKAAAKVSSVGDPVAAAEEQVRRSKLDARPHFADVWMPEDKAVSKFKIKSAQKLRSDLSIRRFARANGHGLTYFYSSHDLNEKFSKPEKLEKLPVLGLPDGPGSDWKPVNVRSDWKTANVLAKKYQIHPTWLGLLAKKGKLERIKKDNTFLYHEPTVREVLGNGPKTSKRLAVLFPPACTRQLADRLSEPAELPLINNTVTTLSTILRFVKDGKLTVDQGLALIAKL